MNISLVIPNWNGKHLLEKNLPSVVAAVDNYNGKNNEIIIVDDASGDNSLLFLKNTFPQIKIIKNEKHEGFSVSCNRGVAESAGEIIILLNNDVSPEIDFLQPLIKHFTDENVFAVGCLEKSLKNGKEILSGKSIGYFKKGLIWHDRAPDQSSAGETFWVAGGSGAFRKSLWEKLGGFDPIYRPFYWEDIDLSYRARKMGYKVLFEPGSSVFHNHESTIGRAYSEEDIAIISLANQLIFFWKNITDPGMLLTHKIFLPYHLFRSLFMSSGDFGKAFFNALKSAKMIIKRRNAGQKLFIKKDRELLSS